MTALLCALLLVPKVADTPTDPAFNTLKQLVGGHWEGSVEKNGKVQFKFTLEQGGTILVANGSLRLGKQTTAMRVSVGWDPEAKQCYYLDQHGHNTVYFGHVTQDGPAVLWDFKALCGDTGHYRSRETIQQDEYRSEMSVEMPNGTWKDLEFHLALHRVK